MKNTLYFGLGLLVVIGGILVFWQLLKDDFNNEAVEELDDISYGVQYISEESSEILF